jgi:hypothetical protein
MALTAYATKYSCPEVLQTIKWVPVDNSQNAKANRIKCLEILLSDDRLHFVGGPWIDELYRQFERFTGEVKKGRKDDIPDSISLAARTLPPSMFTAIKTTPQEDKKFADEQYREQMKKARYERMFGSQSQYDGTRMHPTAPRLPAPTWRERATGRRKDEPVVIEEQEPARPTDPRMVIFGNKGPWRL